MNEINTNINLTLNQKVTGQNVSSVLNKTADSAERVETAFKTKDQIIAAFVRNITSAISTQAGSIKGYESIVSQALGKVVPMFGLEASNARKTQQIVSAATATYNGHIQALVKDKNAQKALSINQRLLAGEMKNAFLWIQQLSNAERQDASAATQMAKAEKEVATEGREMASSVKNASSSTMSLYSVLQPLLSITAAVARVMNGFRTSLSTMYGIMRRSIAMFRRLAHVGKQWFDIATQFAEVNHLLYTSLVNLHTGFKGVTASVKGSEEALSHYNVALQDVLGRDLDKVISFEDKGAADAIRDASKALQEYSYWMMLDPTNVTKTYASFLEMADASKMASDYAVALAQDMTQLTYDMASLWDIPFEESATKLRSALSGITRAIRSQGVDVGRAAADAWLAKKGIDAVYNSLSLGDKMLVQFNLAIEGAVAAQGDLAASVLQPANLFRILKEQVTQTARAFGAALFPMLTAIIPLLITAAEAARRLAVALANFLGRKLGKVYTDAAAMWSAYADNFKDRSGVEAIEKWADATDDFGSSVGGAGSKVKDFKKQLLGFDEINNLTEKETGGGGGGGGGSDLLDFSGLIGIPKYSELMGNVRDQIYGKAAELKQDLKKLFDDKFGENSFQFMIGSLKRFKDAITGTTRSWDEQRSKVAAIRGITDELPSRVTVTEGVVDRLRQQWQRFKDLIGANDFNKFFDDFLKGILDGIDGIQDLIDKLLDLGERLKSSFSGKSTKSFAESLGQIVTYITALTMLSPLLTPLTNAFSTMATGASQLGVGLLGLGGLSAMTKGAGGAAEAATVAKTAKPSRFHALADKFDPVNLIGKAGTTAAPGLSSAELAGKSGAEMMEALSKASTSLSKPAEQLTKLGNISDVVRGKFVSLGEAFRGLSTFGKVNVIVSIILAFVEMVKNSENLRNSLQSLWDAVKNVFAALLPLFEQLDMALKPVWELLGNLLAIVIDGIVWAINNLVIPLIEILTPIIEGIGIALTWIWDKLKAFWDWLTSFFGKTAAEAGISGESMKTSMKDAFADVDWEGLLGGIWDTISTWFSNLWNELVTWLGGIWNSVVTWLGGIWNNIATWFSNLWTTFTTWLSNIWNNLKDWFLGLPAKISERINEIWNKIKAEVDKFLKNPVEWGKNLITGLWNGINQKVEWVKSKISGAFTAIGDKVKKIFGIASPSKLMAEYGGYVMEGFEVGIENGLPSVLETMNQLALGVNDIMNNGFLDMASIADSEMNSLDQSLATGLNASAQAAIDLQNTDMTSYSQQEINLLREQNNLLTAILNKEFGISLDGKQLAQSINYASRIQGRPLIAM